VLGGAFNCLAAPLLFSTLLEYKLVLVLAGLAMPAWKTGLWRRLPVPADPLRKLVPIGLAGVLAAGLVWVGPTPFWKFAVPLLTCSLLLTRPAVFGLGVGAIVLATSAADRPRDVREYYRARSLFGTHSVRGDAAGHCRLLFHGRTLHGAQFQNGVARRVPRLYYDPTGPVGLLFAALRADRSRSTLDPVACVGLGTGSLAAYGRRGEEFTFFEIDPEILHVARTQFTYLHDSRATCQVVLGDARLSLMREPAHKYGLIVLDAFSSGAIPTHLLTSEAIALYQDKITAHGIIALHITNKYLDLEPVVFSVARTNGLVAQACRDEAADEAAIARGRMLSRWVILARRPEDFGPLMDDPRWRPVCRTIVRQWTDDYANLLGVLDLGL
jgi:hypothetical protein